MNKQLATSIAIATVCISTGLYIYIPTIIRPQPRRISQPASKASDPYATVQEIWAEKVLTLPGVPIDKSDAFQRFLDNNISIPESQHITAEQGSLLEGIAKGLILDLGDVSSISDLPQPLMVVPQTAFQNASAFLADLKTKFPSLSWRKLPQDFFQAKTMAPSEAPSSATKAIALARLETKPQAFVEMTFDVITMPGEQNSITFSIWIMEAGPPVLHTAFRPRTLTSWPTPIESIRNN